MVPYNTINMYHSLYNTYNNVVLLSDDTGRMKFQNTQKHRHQQGHQSIAHPDRMNIRGTELFGVHKSATEKNHDIHPILDDSQN